MVRQAGRISCYKTRLGRSFTSQIIFVLFAPSSRIGKMKVGAGDSLREPLNVLSMRGSLSTFYPNLREAFSASLKSQVVYEIDIFTCQRA